MIWLISVSKWDPLTWEIGGRIGSGEQPEIGSLITAGRQHISEGTCAQPELLDSHTDLWGQMSHFGSWRLCQVILDCGNFMPYWTRSPKAICYPCNSFAPNIEKKSFPELSVNQINRLFLLLCEWSTKTSSNLGFIGLVCGNQPMRIHPEAIPRIKGQADDQ